MTDGSRISLPRVVEQTDLVTFSESGRAHRLHPAALEAWRAMKSDAEQAGVRLQLVSAFRSIERQREIVRAKLAKGIPEAEIFRVNARPGFSEHHSGFAIDVTCPEGPCLEEGFEQTMAFQWLTENAWRFGFRLSYPRGNPYGIAYEPWHWCLDRSRDRSVSGDCGENS